MCGCLSVCVCVFVCICVHVCFFVYMRVCMYMCIYMRACVYLCVHMCVCVCVCVCMHLERAVHQGLIKIDHHTVFAVLVDADLREEVFGRRLQREREGRVRVKMKKDEEN